MCEKFKQFLTWKIAILGLIVLLTTTVPVFLYINALNVENDRIKEEFRTDNRQIISSINKAIDNQIIFLKMFSALFSTVSENITRQQFTNFTNHILLLQPSIRAIQWAKRIEDKDREYYEDLAQQETGIDHGFRDRFQNNTFFPSPKRDIYYPIYYVNPFVGNEAVFLYDPSSFNVGFRFSNKSIQQRIPIISTPIFLVQDIGIADTLTPAYILSNAVFNEKNQNLGIGVIIFRLDDLLVNFLTDNDIENIIVSIIDQNRTVTSVHNFNRKPVPYTGELHTNDFFLNTTVSVVDREWVIKTTSKNAYFSSRKTNTPLIILIVAILVILIELAIVGYIIYQAVLSAKKQERIKNTKMHKQLEKEVKFTFINYLSHEIRVPFNTVYSVIQTLMSTENMSKENQSLLKMAKSASKQAIEILSNVLDLEKMEKRLFELDKSWFTLEEMINVVFWTYKKISEEKELDMSLNIDKQISNIELFGDIVRLRQCMSNYVSNAIKFTEKGNIKLYAYEINRDTDFLTIRCEVVDTGCGINDSDQENLFLPYNQLKQVCSAQGTGLGLTIVKSIATMHGGTVGVSSVLGKGCKFYFDFKAKFRHQLSSHIEVEMSESNTPEQKFRNMSGNVLIVEDDESSRNILKHILERRGITCDTAENGKQGVEMVSKNPNKYSVIFMDKTMPILSGIEATKTLRDMGISTPIIALTGNVLLSEREKFLTAGATDWLMKPVEISKLFGAIMNVTTNTT